jgi:hypothetical protein
LTNTQNYIRNGLQGYLDAIIKTCKDELIEQGHKVTGKTEASFKGVVTETSETSWQGVIYVLESAVILNYGVTANRVPFGGSGRGGKSKYIQALLDWAANIKPNLSDKERKSFVFAVAKKAKKEGHPTNGSYAFSKNGRRKDWMEFSIGISQENLRDFLDPQEIYNILLRDYGLMK